MVIDKKIDLIEKYFKKKKECIVTELIIKDYNNTNFYISIVFNKKIEKFKVAYIPLDIVDTNNIENYICYQFINSKMVDYILDSVSKEKSTFGSSRELNNLNKNIGNFYIEFNILLSGEMYSFKTTKYIPKKWTFLFDPIVIMFEHIPNIMGELCSEILSVITNINDPINYKASLNFDLFKDDISCIFSEKTKKEGEKEYNNNEVEFIEKVNGKYFAIVNRHLVIIEYDSKTKILNLYCDCSCGTPSKHIYAALKAIINDEVKEFYKIMIIDKNDNAKEKYYLCFGIENETLKVIEAASRKKLPISLVEEGLVRIVFDHDNKLVNDIECLLKEKYSKAKLGKIISKLKTPID